MSRGRAEDKWLEVQTLVQHGTLKMTKICPGNIEEGRTHRVTHKQRHCWEACSLNNSFKKSYDEWY